MKRSLLAAHHFYLVNNNLTFDIPTYFFGRYMLCNGSIVKLCCVCG